MSERKHIVPEYGPFAGMRIIDTGSLIAMPFAATLLAGFGAEVIHIERPGVGDTLRVLAPFAKEDGKVVSTSWAQDGRNKLSLSLELNLKHPEVKELFYGLIKEADVFMENMVWLEKLAIRDEDLLEVNPRLIIAHISGYGNPAFGGLPEYCDRASYDMIGQAFYGWMGLNGERGGEPVVIRGEKQTVPCKTEESPLWAMERAGIKAPSHCRSGECGWCHSRLISGDVYIPEDADGRRLADKKFGWVHPCCTFPLGDIELEVFPIS